MENLDILKMSKERMAIWIIQSFWDLRADMEEDEPGSGPNPEAIVDRDFLLDFICDNLRMKLGLEGTADWIFEDREDFITEIAHKIIPIILKYNRAAI